MMEDIPERIHISSLFASVYHTPYEHTTEYIRADVVDDKLYNLTCRALDTTPEGREFLAQLDALRAEVERLKGELDLARQGLRSCKFTGCRIAHTNIDGYCSRHTGGKDRFK